MDTSLAAASVMSRQSSGNSVGMKADSDEWWSQPKRTSPNLEDRKISASLRIRPIDRTADSVTWLFIIGIPSPLSCASQCFVQASVVAHGKPPRRGSATSTGSPPHDTDTGDPGT